LIMLLFIPGVIKLIAVRKSAKASPGLSQKAESRIKLI
jgi:hypothetical protein